MLQSMLKREVILPCLFSAQKVTFWPPEPSKRGPRTPPGHKWARRPTFTCNKQRFCSKKSLFGLRSVICPGIPSGDPQILVGFALLRLPEVYSPGGSKPPVLPLWRQKSGFWTHFPIFCLVNPFFIQKVAPKQVFLDPFFEILPCKRFFMKNRQKSVRIDTFFDHFSWYL